ncbi:MAG: Hpt domain-containing protein [Paracoccus sp. (in: a-proteobacteria)]|uniref:Hpt domain-containing protein n=1 Tax=Paracoccus sp. TaxID=267 RepID=UPI0039E243EC
MLDWNRIRELRDEVGEDEFRVILELSLDEVETVMVRLSIGCPMGLVADLHFLNGCASNLGLQCLSLLCGRGEKLASQNRLAQADLDELMESYSASKQRLIAELAAERLVQRRA